MVGKAFAAFLLLSLIFLELCVSFVASGKILVIYPHGSKSHLTSLTPFMKTMMENGHAVTVLQISNTDKAEAIGNATVEHWIVRDSLNALDLLNQIIWNNRDHSDKHYKFFLLMEGLFGECIQQLSDKIPALLNQDWDLIVSDGLFTNHGITFARTLKRRRNVPYIVYDTTFVFQYQASALAFGGSWAAQVRMWSFFPKDTLDTYEPSDIRSRFPNFLETLVETFTMNTMLSLYVGNIQKFVDEPYSQHNYLTGSSLFVSDEIRGFGQTTPRTSRLLPFSSFCPESTTLPPSLAEFVEDKNSKGTIYVAFGTMIMFMHAPSNLRDEFFDALDALEDYRVVFATRTKGMRPFKAHVRVVEWAPQVALLNHPKTKVFVSHGGLKSFKEAVCAKRPMTMLPFFAEQGRNAMVAAKMGLATVLNKFTFNKAIILKEILTAAEDERYAQRMRQTYEMFVDNPIPHKDEIAFAVSRILRRRGEHMRHEHRGESLCSFHYYSLDIVVIVLLIITVSSI